MRASLLLSLCLAASCSVAFLAGCGDSDDAMTGPGGHGSGAKKPPTQKAVSLTTKTERPPGTRFRNSATLTMVEANMKTRSRGESVDGKVTTILRDLWEVNQISPTRRDFTIEDMSMTNESVIGGRKKSDRTESTLGGIVFEVERADETAPWKVVPQASKLSSLQEVELTMLGNLWDEGRESLYPDEPLAIGQTWMADPQAFGTIVSPRLRVEEGKVVCRLDEITVLRGERCGAISVDVDISGTFEMAGGAGIHVQIALAGTIMRSLYRFHDMRTELKGSMQMEMEFPESDTTISIDGVAEFLQMADINLPKAIEALDGEAEPGAAEPDGLEVDQLDGLESE